MLINYFSVGWFLLPQLLKQFHLTTEQLKKNSKRADNKTHPLIHLLPD